MEVNFTNLNLLDMFADGIKRGKDSTFAIYQKANGSREEYSYNYLSQQTDKLLQTMKKAGLKKGDRIGVISSLRPWWFSLHYACLKAGYIMVCIDPGVPANQLTRMLLETEVRAVFTSLGVVHLPKELDKHIPVYSINEDFPLLSKCDKVDSILLGKVKKFPEDTFYVMFSSGTTSENRKIVLLSSSTITTAIEHNMNHDAHVYRNTNTYSIAKKDLCLFPPYHIAGLCVLDFDIYCNTAIIMLERMTPNALISSLQDLKPDNLSTVPSMLTSLHKKITSNYSNKPLTKTTINLLLGISGTLRKYFGIKAGLTLLKPINKQAFGGNMRSFRIGASPFDYETNKFFLDMGISVEMAYGLTELGAPLATTGQGYYPGTCGKTVKHNDELDIRIVNKDESDRGEVEVLSPYCMISYLNPKDNIGCFTEDGYFKTGDLGYFDKNNCLNICGRIKESIVLKNGEKLLPEEIESKYQGIYCVDEVAAFKVPGVGGCDDFALAAIKNKSCGIQDDAIKMYFYERAEHLPPMYKPKDIYIVKEFPLSSSHKIQRFRLTQMAVNGDSEPTTDASMIPVDEDKTTAKLRTILINIGGVEWKTKKLTQGLLLGLDSLATVDLYVAIQEEWNIDLFQTTSQPATFGELLDIIKNYDAVEKNKKKELDLSKYPLPASRFNKLASDGLERLTKQMYHVKGYGQSNLPKDSNFLLCSNHRTTLDPAFICSCLSRKTVRNTCIIGKAEIIENKLLKLLVANHNFIPIDRTGNSIQTLDRSRELLFEGKNILIFPEGTNIENNTTLLPLKDGAAKLAIATNKPIVPVHITGVAHVEKEVGDFFLPPLKSKIRIKFGKPIYPEDMDVQELNELLREKIEELN